MMVFIKSLIFRTYFTRCILYSRGTIVKEDIMDLNKILKYSKKKHVCKEIKYLKLE